MWKKIGFWVRYGLTLKGRITVAKSLLLSQYTYVATILDSNDKKITDKIQAQIDLFVYQNKAVSKDNSSFHRWIQEDIFQGGSKLLILRTSSNRFAYPGSEGLPLETRNLSMTSGVIFFT